MFFILLSCFSLELCCYCYSRSSIKKREFNIPNYSSKINFFLLNYTAIYNVIENQDFIGKKRIKKPL